MIIVYHRHDKTPLGGRAKQFLPQNRRKIASEFEQVRNSGDFSAINRHEIAMKSQVVYTCDLKSHQKSPLKSHQNRTKIASKIACVNGPVRCGGTFLFLRSSTGRARTAGSRSYTIRHKNRWMRGRSDSCRPLRFSSARGRKSTTSRGKPQRAMRRAQRNPPVKLSCLTRKTSRS